MAEKQKDIKIIFMGTSPFARTVLEALFSVGYDLPLVITQPDKKIGRNQESQASSVKEYAKMKKLEILTPDKLDEEIVKKITTIKPDLIVVVAYGKILPKNILDIPKYGSLNIHASLLPKYRGPSPIHNALLNGETETGITIIKIDSGVDTGGILLMKKTEIGPDETIPELSDRLASLSVDAILEAIPAWIEGKISPHKQDKSQVVLCQMIERSDGRIIWTDDAQSIYNRYRAFYTWPGIFTFWEQDGALKRLKLNKISFLKNNPETKHHIGEVFEIGDDIGVQTTLGVVIIKEIQAEGKSNVTIKDFLNGYPDFIGALLK